MLKELRLVLFIFVISIFVFFSFRYYFSDENKKNSFRSINEINKKIEAYVKKKPILDDNTKNIIEYVKKDNQKKKKEFNFWKLIKNNE